MLRVVSEPTDTCSHRKGGFTCEHMYLFVLKQQARRGTALQGGALVLPTGAMLQRRNCNPAGLQSHPAALGLGTVRSRATGKDSAPGGTRSLSLQATEQLFNKHHQLPAQPHLSTLLGAPETQWL